MAADDELFVAVNRDSTVVSIAGYVGYYFQWTGQMDLLIHNAIMWLESAYDIPWLTIEPVTGTVPANTATTEVQIFFNTLNYLPGEFKADLIARTNNPYKPDLQVLVTMTVVSSDYRFYLPLVLNDASPSQAISDSSGAVPFILLASVAGFMFRVAQFSSRRKRLT